MSTGRVVRWAGRAAVITAVVGIVAALFDVGPIHAAACAWQGRDGFIVELPAELRTPQEVRRVVRAQTRCVPVEVGYVSWGVVGEGLLARSAGPLRRWVPLGESIKIWVEGTPEQATDPCRPADPRHAPPSGCPDAPQPDPG